MSKCLGDKINPEMGGHIPYTTIVPIKIYGPFRVHLVPGSSLGLQIEGSKFSKRAGGPWHSTG